MGTALITDINLIRCRQRLTVVTAQVASNAFSAGLRLDDDVNNQISLDLNN
jgi:hypothetical protein